jgi:hypothetical protein
VTSASHTATASTGSPASGTSRGARPDRPWPRKSRRSTRCVGVRVSTSHAQVTLLDAIPCSSRIGGASESPSCSTCRATSPLRTSVVVTRRAWQTASERLPSTALDVRSAVTATCDGGGRGGDRPCR